MNQIDIDEKHIEATIAKVLQKQLGIDPALTLSGCPFAELDPSFDSLAFVEMQLLIEDEYGVQFDDAILRDKLNTPKNAADLAAVLYSQIKVLA